MTSRLAIAAVAACAWTFGFTGVQAADTWPVDPLKMQLPGVTTQKPVEIVLDIADRPGGGFMIVPDRVSVQTGLLHKIVLRNASRTFHDMVAPAFAVAVDTRSVDVDGGMVFGVPAREVSPALHRMLPVTSYVVRKIELAPGGEAEWVFVASQAGQFPLKCRHPAHVEAGMTARIAVGSYAG